MTETATTSPGRSTDWVAAAVDTIARARVTVFGDFCLDAYWLIDAEQQELSIETGLPVHRVRTQRYSPGGAGNVAANLATLGAKSVRAVGIVGADLFGGELLSQLESRRINTDGLLRDGGWQTFVYSKPYVHTNELSRLDFGSFNALSQQATDELLKRLDAAAAESDVVVINQQIHGALFTPQLIRGINAIAAKRKDTVFVVDSRNCGELFEHTVLKLNAREAARIVGEKIDATSAISRAQVIDFAKKLTNKSGKPVFLTRGEHGLVVADKERVLEFPGVYVLGKTDPVGAGDSVVAAVAAILGGKGDVETAGRIANLAASITVRKIQTTGTVTASELRQFGQLIEYIYEPELADMPHQARFHGDTEIEIVREQPRRSPIRHAIFDHDGTLSTLRQGWEKIMEPMMIKAVLGDAASRVSVDVYNNVVKDVRSFINATTGVHTLAQMKGLIGLIREYGFVPEDKLLDEHGYKAIYNEALMEMVRVRIKKIQRGELSASDFEMKGCREFVEALDKAGVTMYLASGTDEADVKAEAAVMGYAHYFKGGIRGAVGDVNVEAKRVVMEKLLSTQGINSHELAVLGDGPVEIREGRKRGAFCVGVASDELRRHGLDLTKRSRLIRAGADVIIADYSQRQQLLPFFGL